MSVAHVQKKMRTEELCLEDVREDTLPYEFVPKELKGAVQAARQEDEYAGPRP